MCRYAFIIMLYSSLLFANDNKCLLAGKTYDEKTMLICEKALLNESMTPIDKSTIYINQAKYLIMNHRFNEANKSLTLAFNINPKMLENGRYRHSWLRIKGALFFTKEEYVSALPFFEQALEVAKIIDDKAVIANSYNDLGATNLEMGRYTQALKFLQKSYQIKSKGNGDFVTALTLTNIAEIHLVMNHNIKALEYFNLSIKLLKSLKGQSQKQYEVALAKVFISVAHLNISLSNHTESINNLNSAIAIYDKYDLKGGVISGLSALGKLYIEQKNYDRALAKLLIAQKIENSLESQDNLELKSFLVKAYIMTKQWEKAEKIALYGLNQTQNKTSQEFQEVFLLYLSTIYQHTGRLNQSVETLKKAQKIKIELLKEKYNKTRGILLTEIELNKKQHELVKLEQEKIQREYHNNKQQLIFMATALLLLFIIGYLLVRLRIKGKMKQTIATDRALHTSELKQLTVEKSEIEQIFNNINSKILCFDTAGNLFLNTVEAVKKPSLNNKMQEQYSNIWEQVMPHLNENEKLSEDLFFEDSPIENAPGGIWVHQMNFLDDILVCIFLNDKDNNTNNFIDAEKIRNYTDFKHQLSTFLTNTKNFPVCKMPKLNQVTLSLKGINRNEMFLHLEEDSSDKLNLYLVDLMICCIDIWQKTTGKSTIELAESSGLWLVSIEDGQLRTRTLNRYLDIKKTPKHPRWRQVVKTAHFILSNCNVNINDRQILNKKTETIKQIIRNKAIGS